MVLEFARESVLRENQVATVEFQGRLVVLESCTEEEPVMPVGLVWV